MSYPSQEEEGVDPALDNLLAEAEPGQVVEAELEDLIDDIGDVVGRRVREFRTAHDLTAAELAERAGLSQAMLSKVENARSSPSLSTLARLSQALGVPLTALFRGLDEDHDAILVKSGQGLQMVQPNSVSGVEYSRLGMLGGQHQRLEPLLITIDETADRFPHYQHGGSELIHMLWGAMEYSYGTNRFVLEAGDTFQFVGDVTHGIHQILQMPVQFLSIKAWGAVSDESGTAG
ncbi:MAG: helix-turn-helix domain-containing protein [Actinomycetia bacterium]|nr:helix-turn-helix domain-containing protein [Actinomycetes bacterium]